MFPFGVLATLVCYSPCVNLISVVSSITLLPALTFQHLAHMSRPKRCQAMASATVCVCAFSQWFILPRLETWCWKPLAGSQLTSRPRSGAPTLTLQPTVWILRICPSCISLIICSIIWSVVDNMQGAKDEPYGGTITFQEWFSIPTLQQKFWFLQASCILAWIVCRLGCSACYLQIICK